MREVKVTGPDMRRVEQAVRSSGFMSLMSRYMAPRPGADLMTRTIQVQMDGQTKSVVVQDGADAPRAFETVWAAIQDALNSKGTVTRPWQSAS
jgi:gamma-glutamylcysteine synthetase